jgi:hypothetical protein
MMELSALFSELFERKITMKLDRGRICLQPVNIVTDDILNSIRNNKPEIIRHLSELSPVTGLPIYLNPPGCHNPFTPHSEHEFPWECDPNSCYCYRMFGYPRLCQGVPCRWIWPDGVPDKDDLIGKI